MAGEEELWRGFWKGSEVARLWRGYMERFWTASRQVL